MATRPILVTILKPKTLFLGDETYSRHHFEAKNFIFGDETLSRRHFEPKNFIFWRRDPFSSSF
ncbi:hypothetical protein [Caldifermentibacillus hisashii]|uniref:hypothetical protein n=1 Tax=Caldifermentibacillus hisashii TaxID=996558 RepID=UPI001C10BA39|nr:hypothetical protein [Caldifermentibacillus hisashii]MBU5340555.1 hypothetical protein [Caldifermentibacillus hisashii]